MWLKSNVDNIWTQHFYRSLIYAQGRAFCVSKICRCSVVSVNHYVGLSSIQLRASNRQLQQPILWYYWCWCACTEEDPRPAPIIHQGPQNQTLPINSIALLQCLATGEPPPGVRWYRSGRPLSLRDQRYTLLHSGTLQISGKPSSYHEQVL